MTPTASPTSHRSDAPLGGGFGSVEAGAARPTTGLQVANARFQAVVAKTGNAARSSAGSGVGWAALEILSKPRPDYTDEARRLRIEGEVLLEALFPATGQIRVLRVLRGLGHGLDENAFKAAMAIRFRPAIEHGQPLDTVANVRIVFQLAY